MTDQKADLRAINDAERSINRLMAMTDEELMAEVTRLGIDPEDNARRCRAIFQRVLTKIKAATARS